MLEMRRILLKILSFLNFSSGAALGFILYPLVKLYKILESAFIFSGISAILIPLVAFGLGSYMHYHFQVGFIGATVIALIISGALTGLFFGVMPLIFAIEALLALSSVPLEGLNAGWNEGLFPVLVNAFGKLFGAMSFRMPEFRNYLVSQNTRILGAVNMDINTIFLRLGRATTNIASRPMDGGGYNSLALSALEVTTLQSSQQPRLTPDEISQLERVADVALDLSAYKNVLRLDTDQCPILLDRPELGNTVVLAKQYKRGAHWLPVPGVINIFDKNLLEESFRFNAVHPINRDCISTPSPYRVAYNEFQTRYITHPYYSAVASVSRPGTCQEINLLTTSLRARLLEEMQDEFYPALEAEHQSYSSEGLRL